MKSLFRPFPLPLTRKQWFYLLVIQGLGAGIIDGGANFGIAYAMYHNQKIVKMWVFSQNTIAGDLGVTPIIQCLASMLITSTLVHTDLHHHSTKPLPFVYPHVEHLPDPRSLFRRSRPHSTDIEKSQSHTSTEPSSSSATPTLTPHFTPRSPKYYLQTLLRFIFEGTENNTLSHPTALKSFLFKFAYTAAQGAALGIIFGFPIWCLAIIILGPIYGNGNMGNKWAPQVIKMVYGAVVGWVTNPVIAILALGSQADQSLLVVVEDDVGVEEEREGGGEVEGGGRGEVGRISEEREEGQEGEEVLRVSTPTPASRRDERPQISPALSTRISRLPITPTRSRAGSITRPPLTANVSNLSTILLGSPIPLTPGIAPSRPRGATITSTEGGSVRSYSYVLGGTGGRAQRPRAGTRVSLADVPQTGILPPTTSEGVNVPIEGRTAAWDVFGRTDRA